MDSLTSQIIVDIIKTELELEDNDVWVDELGRNIPQGDNLMVTVGMSDAQVTSSSSFLEERDIPVVGSVYEVQQAQARENINVDIFSRSPDALIRRWEIIAALGSIYSQQQQEINSFKIFKIPNSFINTSSAEGGSQLARYTLSFACHVWYKKDRLLGSNDKNYYDTFKTRLDDKNTIDEIDGLIEFTIDDNTVL